MRSHLQRIFQLGPPQICPTPLERLQLPALFHFQSYILCRKMKKSPENKNMVLCLLAVDPLKSTSSKLGQISTTTCISLIGKIISWTCISCIFPVHFIFACGLKPPQVETICLLLFLNLTFNIALHHLQVKY